MSSEDPTTYRVMNINTGFLKKEFYDLTEMLLHPHSLQNDSLKLIHIDRGTTNISKIHRTSMTSQIKVYDIEGYEETSMHPFHITNLHKLIRYNINAGVITHFTFTKKLHDHTNLNDVEKIR